MSFAARMALIGPAMTLLVTVAASHAAAWSALDETHPAVVAASSPKVVVRAGPKKQVPGCTSASCRYVRTKTSSFSTRHVHCHVTSNLGSAGFIAWSQRRRQVKDGPNVFGNSGGWVKVTCAGVSSHKFVWP